MSLQVELLEQSFEGIKPYADAFVNSFYQNLFIASPEAQPLFANTNMAEQKTKSLNFLVLVVENLRTPELLDKSLRGLGARYAKYGALPAHYPLFGNALLTTFEQYLKEQWTPEVKQAWVDAYGAISEIMLNGTDYSQTEIALDPPNKPSESSKVVEENSNSSDTSLEIDLLETSFLQIRPRLLEFASSFYNNLFITYPDTKILFAQTDMEVQKQKLVDSLLLVVLNLRQPGFLTESLKELGARHVGYGTLISHYPLIGEILLTTFEQYLGSDWNPKVKQAWSDAYGLISDTMIEGAKEQSLIINANKLENLTKLADSPYSVEESEASASGINKKSNLTDRTEGKDSFVTLLTAILTGSTAILILLFILL